MTYLWLNGNRMDSIPLLRSYLQNCDEASRTSACAELLKKYKAGVLAGWIARQAEAQPVSQLMRGLNQAGGTPPSRIPELMDAPVKDTQSVLPILAELCMIDLLDMEEMLESVSEELEESNDETFALIQKQSWYQASKQMQELLRDVNREFVITDISTFHTLADRYDFADKNRTKQHTVYLCNTGKPFQLSNPNRYWNLRFVGCGNPMMRFGSHNRGQELDLELHDMMFQDLVLHLQGVRLSGTEGRLPGVEMR